MKPSTGATVRNHRIAVRVRPESLSAFKWNACPPSPDYAVEIEIGVLKSQCLDRRIDNRHRLASEIAAWQRQRNQSGARIKWMFSTEKARSKMARAYPKPAFKES